MKQDAGADLTEDEVMTFVAERIAPHKKVRAVEFIDQIPKSACGKILRKDLRARENAASLTRSGVTRHRPRSWRASPLRVVGVPLVEARQQVGEPRQRWDQPSGW